MTVGHQVLLLLAVFAGVTLIALAFGAANLGTALAIGQIGFMVVLVYLLLRR